MMSTTKSPAESAEAAAPAASNAVLLIVTWLWVGVPFLYGVYKLITTASKLFVH